MYIAPWKRGYANSIMPICDVCHRFQDKVSCFFVATSGLRIERSKVISLLSAIMESHQQHNEVPDNVDFDLLGILFNEEHDPMSATKLSENIQTQQLLGTMIVTMG